MNRAILLLALPVFLAAGSSMVATDLYLPAIPMLPAALGGDAAGAQYTLAAFFATFAVGQLVFGTLADLYDRRLILTWALAAFAVTSVACALAETMTALIVMRAVQGLAASAGTALAPALLREAGDDSLVVRLTSIVSSMEAVFPAIAPVIGAWLVVVFDWESTFWVMAAIAVFTMAAFQVFKLPSAPPLDPDRPPARVRYWRLMVSRRFMGYQVSHALAFAGLIIYIMATPYLLVTYLGHTTTAFVVMQVTLIIFFVVFANTAGVLSDRFGIDRIITIGAWLQMLSAVLFLSLVIITPALMDAVSFTVTMVPMAIGLGLRGGPGFAKAKAFAGKHTGSAGGLMMFTGMGLSAVGTQLVAPTLPDGPLIVAGVVVLCCLASLALLPMAMRRDPDDLVAEDLAAKE